MAASGREPLQGLSLDVWHLTDSDSDSQRRDSPFESKAPLSPVMGLVSLTSPPEQRENSPALAPEVRVVHLFGQS
jgi:hypothetical protein